MPDPTMSEVQEDLIFRKNNNEFIKCTASFYQDILTADLRVWFVPKDSADNDPKPSKKGLNIRYKEHALMVSKWLSAFAEKLPLMPEAERQRLGVEAELQGFTPGS